MKRAGTEMVGVSDLKLDVRVQRAERPGWVAKHAPMFDVESLGVLHVSRRRKPIPPEPAGMYVIDGWGRVNLCLAVGPKSRKVEAKVYESLTLREEAGLFRRLNDKTTHRPIDNFKIAVVEGLEPETVCNGIVQSHGLRVESSTATDCIRAVSALLDVYEGAWHKSAKKGAMALNKALGCIVAAWGKDSRNFDGAVIRGVGYVMLREPTLDQRKLVERLQRVSNGALGLLMKARGYRDIHGVTLSNATASVVVRQYNRQRSTRKLAAWAE